MSRPRIWSDDQFERMKSMRLAGDTYIGIAHALGKPDSENSVRFWLKKMLPGFRPQYSIRKLRHNRPSVVVGHVVSTKVEIPVHVIADRDRRANEYRTTSQIMFGDPPLSQSALGQSFHE